MKWKELREQRRQGSTLRWRVTQSCVWDGLLVLKHVVDTQLIFVDRKFSPSSQCSSLKCNGLFLTSRPLHVLFPQPEIPSSIPPSPTLEKFYSSFRFLHTFCFSKERPSVGEDPSSVLPSIPPLPVTPACSFFWLPLQTENSRRAGTTPDY